MGLGRAAASKPWAASTATAQLASRLAWAGHAFGFGEGGSVEAQGDFHGDCAVGFQVPPLLQEAGEEEENGGDRG